MSARLEAQGEKVRVTGAMTFANAAALLAEGSRQIGEGRTTFDLSAVTAFDSAGLAVLFGWQRAARAAGKALALASPPENLISLAEVYGVRDFLPLLAA